MFKYIGVVMSSFGKRINSVMLRRGMTQKSLASKLKISEQQLHSVLKDKSLSTIDTLRELSVALDTPTDYFLQDFDKKFLIYAIDDYLSQIERNDAQKIIENLSAIIGDKDE
ncbi:MAG: helix-turn-helix transcriptional regulator [Clostridiales bacterium]|nr:helix-turn-helix transcriptional regulator [Clostridiales bacterium]